MQQDLNSTLESLESHFFVVLDEFGTLSPIDPNSFDNSEETNWMPDESSKACLLCGSSFTVTRRRHHCRYCGMLFCGNCTDNRTMIGDSIERICDSCAVILIPPGPSAKYSGLKKWCEEHDCLAKFEENLKNTGITFLVHMLSGGASSVGHLNAIRTLYKLLPIHAPALISSEVPLALLKHSIECKESESAALSLDLFVTLYNTNSQGCNINFDEFHVDATPFFDSESIEMKRSAARLLYTLVISNNMKIENVAELLKIKDKWVVAYILSAMAKKDNFALKHEEIIPILLDIIRKDNKEVFTVAASYYASFVLNRLTQNKEATAILAKSDLQPLTDLLFANSPKDQNDKRPEAQIALNLATVLLNVWKLIAEEKAEDHAILFSQVLMPLFEVMGLPNEVKGESALGQVQIFFMEMIRQFASFDDLKQSVRSEQMLSILSGFSSGDDKFSQEAAQTLESLNE